MNCEWCKGITSEQEGMIKYFGLENDVYICLGCIENFFDNMSIHDIDDGILEIKKIGILKEAKNRYAERFIYKSAEYGYQVFQFIDESNTNTFAILTDDLLETAYRIGMIGLDFKALPYGKYLIFIDNEKETKGVENAES